MRQRYIPERLAQAVTAPPSRPVGVTLGDAPRLLGVSPDDLGQVQGAATRRALDGGVGSQGEPQKPFEPSPWLTVKEAAEYAKLKPDTVYSAVEVGELRHARVAGRRTIRIRRVWVDTWLDGHARGGVEPVTHPVTDQR